MASMTFKSIGSKDILSVYGVYCLYTVCVAVLCILYREQQHMKMHSEAQTASMIEHLCKYSVYCHLF